MCSPKLGATIASLGSAGHWEVPLGECPVEQETQGLFDVAAGNEVVIRILGDGPERVVAACGSDVAATLAAGVHVHVSAVW